MKIFLNTTDLNNPTIEITENKMTLQKLFTEAQNRYFNGYSESRLVDYVFLNANNKTQATKILNKILK
jgi:hypothetical protein